MQAVAGALGEISKDKEHFENLQAEEGMNAGEVAAEEIFGEASQVVGGNVIQKDSQTFANAYLGKFEEKVSKIAGGMNRGAARVFQKRVALIRDRLSVKLASHEGRQLEVYADGVDTGTIALETENAVKNMGHMDLMAGSLVRIEGAVDSMAQRKGWSPEREAVERQKTMGAFHGAIIGAALDAGKLNYAKDYLDQHGKEMDPDALDKARNILDGETRFRKVNTSVDQVDASGKTFSEKAQMLRDIFKDDDQGQKAAIAELHARKVQQDVSRDEALGRLWDFWSGLNGGKRMSLHDIQKTPEWGSLDGTARKNLARDFESDARRNEGKETPAEAVAKYATYLRALDDPGGLMKSSDQEIMGKYTATLGSDLTKKLLAQKRELGNDFNKLRVASIDARQFKDLAREYGLKVDGNLTDSDRAITGALRDRVLDVIRSEQQTTGKELGGDRKEQIIRGLLKQVPTRKPGGPLASALGPAKYAFQLGGAYEIGASDEEKTAAYGYLVRNGAPTTPENMWAMIEAMRGNQ